MAPHIEFVVTEQEMGLVVRLDDQELTVDQIAELMGLPLEEAEVFVTNAYHRKAVIEWQLQEYIDIWEPAVESVQQLVP